MRRVVYRCTREFQFEIEVEDDHPEITDAAEFFALHGPESPYGMPDSMLVSERVEDYGA